MPSRDHLHAQVAEVLPRVLKGLLTRLPLEVPELGRVTVDQLGALGYVVENPGCAMGELAVARGIAVNSATALVDRLVLAGLAQRSHCEDDRRVVRVQATQRGSELLAQLRQARRAAYRRMLDSLDDADLQAIEAALPALTRLAGVPAGALR
jgi:DNA-binding MarR family transcriptional regulator